MFNPLFGVTTQQSSFSSSGLVTQQTKKLFRLQRELPVAGHDDDGLECSADEEHPHGDLPNIKILLESFPAILLLLVMLRGERHHEAGHDEAEEGDEEDEGDADHAEAGLDHGVDDGGLHPVHRGQSSHCSDLLSLVAVTGAAVHLAQADSEIANSLPEDFLTFKILILFSKTSFCSTISETVRNWLVSPEEGPCWERDQY